MPGCSLLRVNGSARSFGGFRFSSQTSNVYSDRLRRWSPHWSGTVVTLAKDDELRSSFTRMQYFAAPAGSTPIVTSWHVLRDRYSRGGLLDGICAKKCDVQFAFRTDRVLVNRNLLSTILRRLYSCKRRIIARYQRYHLDDTSLMYYFFTRKLSESRIERNGISLGL